MNKIKNSSRLILYLIIYGFVVHIFAMNFLWTNKVLCRMNDKVSIEKTDISGNCEHKSKAIVIERNYFTDTQCEDYQLTKHYDDYRITFQKNINCPGKVHYLAGQSAPVEINTAGFVKIFNIEYPQPYSLKVKNTSSLLI